MFRRIAVALIAVSALIISLFVGGAPASAAVTKTPVVFVHGYGECQDAGVVMEGPFAEQYYTGTPIGDLHHIAYYGCDTDGDSIVGMGPNNTISACASSAGASCNPNLHTPDGDGQNTSITRFAYELAWYLYNKFGATRPVDLVGASMGGIIITYALQRIAAHDPAYPTALKVPAVVTFSTPFGGTDLGTYDTTELQQLLPTSATSLIPAIQRSGAVQMNKGGYTIWAAIGSVGCDVVAPSSSTNLRGATFAIVYGSPCYTHVGYLWDAFAKADASGTENGVPFANGLHALDFMHYVISYQETHGT